MTVSDFRHRLCRLALAGSLAGLAASAASALPGVLFESAFEDAVQPGLASEGTVPVVAGEPRFVPGVRGKAIVLQMNRDRLRYPCAGNMLADQGSLSLWVKPLNYDCVEQRGFKVFWQVGYLDWCLYHYQQNYMLLLLGGGSQPPGLAFYARPQREQWSHYVATWDRRSGIAQVYCDGRNVASQEQLPPPEKLPASFCIGNATDWSTPDGPYETAFDECRIYDRALNDTEVAGLYASYLPPVETAPTLWTVPFVSTPPHIDGVVDGTEWRDAACLGAFVSLQQGRSLARRQTQCWLAWDDQCLYLAFSSPHPAKDDVLITVRGRDANAYEDESYEIFLWPNPEDPNLYFQIVGSLGALYDSRRGDTAFDVPGLECRNSQREGRFEAEFALPFAGLGLVPRDGMAWKAILARNYIEGGLEFTTWTRISAGYSEPENAGRLVFARDAPAIRLLSPGDLLLGQARPVLELANRGAQEQRLAYELSLGVAVDRPDPDFTERSSVTVGPGETVSVTPQWPAVRGDHRVALLRVRQSREGGDILADLAVPFIFVPRLEGALVSLPSRSELRLRLDARALGVRGGTFRGHATLRGAESALVAETAWLPGENGWADVVFPTGRLAVGPYEVEARLAGEDGQTIAAWTSTWDKLDPNPWWLTDPVGLEQRVPKPFTPVQTTLGPEPSKVGVAVWGRTLRWDRSALPVALTTQGNDVLTAPMRLLGLSEGTPWENPDAVVELPTAAADQALVRAMCRAPGLRIETTSRVAFDGMMLTTLRLTPEADGTTVDKLALEVPLKPEFATLLHYNGCSASGGGWAGERPEPWRSDFRPIVWLGNEQGGLCFFAENRDGWRVQDTEASLQVTTHGGAAVFRLNLFDHPTLLAGPVEITFGFIATPLRPLPDNWLCWTWQTITHFQPQRGMDYVPRPHETVLSIPWWDESQCFLHEHYGDWATWAKERAWHHDHGRRFVKYTQTLGLGDTPERRFWGHEWEMSPRDGRSYCPASDFRHLTAAGLAERILRGTVDGIYFDVAFPKPCANSDHGCSGGYTILAQRELRRRVANLFEQAGREGIIFEHMSMNMYGPMMSFATVYLDGEQYYGRVHDDYRPALSLGYLRAINTGANWGLVPQFLPMVTTKDPEAARRASDSLVALWTLHAPLRHCIAWRAGPVYGPALELDQAFDFSPDTKRLGYWENSASVSVTPDHIRVTLYHKPGRMLLVASNLSDEEAQARIRLQTAAIGLPPEGLRLQRALDNQPAPAVLADGVLAARIRPNSCVLCILESKE
jgi:hypothetical protein